MAEQYLCKGHLVNFSNGGADLLQSLWIKELKNLEDRNHTLSLLNRLELENSRSYGSRAYGIDGIHEDYETVEPIQLFLKINNKVISNFERRDWIDKYFGIEYTQDWINYWIQRLVLISNAIAFQIDEFYKVNLNNSG